MHRPPELQPEHYPAEAIVSMYESSPVPVDTIDACQVSQDVDAFLDIIVNSPNLNYSSATDSCVLAMIDSMTVTFLTTGRDRYLDAFNALSRKSDGYVSTALREIAGPQLLQQRPEEIGRYLYRHREQVKGLEDMVTWGAASEVYYAGERQKTRDEFHSLITQRCPSRITTGESRVYFDSLWQRVEEHVRIYEE